ncbi:MAG TPA: hypothetical protein VEO56_03770 [Bacteroidota bacterium]|nr:hypothetical protein [Bacteroidota bacterium]
MRREDLGVLLDLGLALALRPTLDELSFHAKAVDRTQRIIKRIGHDAQGYDLLARELNDAVQRVLALLRVLLGGDSGEARTRFEERYFPMTAGGFENLLALCHDLAWYKNWLIDNGSGRKASA